MFPWGLVHAQANEPAAFALSPVTVTATRFPQRPAELPFGVSVLTASDIRASGVSTVNEAIMKLLGVSGRLDTSGGENYTLDLRGFGVTAASNQVVILDGVRIDEGDLNSPRLAGIAIDSVERIEVIHGSGSVLYGEGATGGVIVISTKANQNRSRQNQADLYAAGGSFGRRELRGSTTLVAGSESGDIAIDASAVRRDANNHRENFRSKSEAGALTLQWSNEWLRAGARYSADRLSSGLPGGLSAAQYAADPQQASTPSDSARLDDKRGGVFAEASMGEWQVAMDAGSRGKSGSSSFGGFIYAYDVDAGSASLRARHSAHVGTVQNDLMFGVDHDQWLRNVAFSSTSFQNSVAIYLKDEVTLPGGTRLSLGGRVAHVRKTDDGGAAGIDEHPTAWQLGAVQPLGHGVATFGNLGTSFRLANADEFTFTAPGSALKPQTSRDAEFGLRWTHRQGRAEVRIYRSAMSNEIGYDPDAVGPFGPGANVNFDPTRRQGVEVEAEQALNAHTRLRLNASVRRARFQGGPHDGKDLPLTPQHALSVRVDWSAAQGHHMDGGVNIVGAQHPDFANACTMPSHAVADVRYAYRWRMAEFSVGVDNLADLKYYTQAFVCTGAVVGGIYPEAGRALTASLRLHF